MPLAGIDFHEVEEAGITNCKGRDQIRTKRRLVHRLGGGGMHCDRSQFIGRYVPRFACSLDHRESVWSVWNRPGTSGIGHGPRLLSALTFFWKEWLGAGYTFEREHNAQWKYSPQFVCLLKK